MPVRKNKLKQALREGRTVFGSSVRLPEPGLVELLGQAGFDFVVIDGEHGSVGWADIERMVLAAYAVDTVPVVRVLRNEPELVMRTLDLGAMGVLVPHVRTADDARRFRDGALYSPAGSRGVGVGRGGNWGGVPPDEYFRTINDEVVLLAMIEDAEAIDHIDSIAAVGLDILWVGSHDLAASYGLIGQPMHPRVQTAADAVVAACQPHGVAVGYPARDAEDARAAIGRGFRAIGFGTAELFVAQQGRAFLSVARTASRQ